LETPWDSSFSPPWKKFSERGREEAREQCLEGTFLFLLTPGFYPYDADRFHLNHHPACMQPRTTNRRQPVLPLALNEYYWESMSEQANQDRNPQMSNSSHPYLKHSLNERRRAESWSGRFHSSIFAKL
jgi:hypothetical protein